MIRLLGLLSFVLVTSITTGCQNYKNGSIDIPDSDGLSTHFKARQVYLNRVVRDARRD